MGLLGRMRGYRLPDRYIINVKDIIVVIIALLLCLIPLAVKLIVIDKNSMIAGFFSGGQQLANVFGQVDAFSLIKVYMLYIFAIVLALLFSIAVRRQSIVIDTDYVVLICFAFGIWILVTAYLSMNPAVAFFGVRDRFEGAFAFCAYIIIMTVARYTINANWHIHMLMIAILTGGTIIAIIAIMQFFGINILAVPYISEFISGSVFKDVAIIQATKGSAYGTLYNPNYLSGYMAMILFVPITYYLFTNRSWIRYVMLILSVLCWMGLLSSKSSSGFVAAGIGMLIVILIKLFINRFNRQSWKQISILILCFIIAFIGMNVASDGVMWGEYTSIFGYLYQLASIDVSDITGQERLIDFEQLDKVQADKWRQLLSYYPYESTIDRLGSGRGFIWRNTVMLIKERPIIGYGLDTIMYNLPQGDLRKLYAFGHMNIIVDKPHSLYLQLAHGAGIPALILFIIMNTIVLWKTAVVLYRRLDIKLLAIGMLVFAYLVQGVFNDSTVGVSVIYWVMLGVLMKLIFINSYESYEKDKEISGDKQSIEYKENLEDRQDLQENI